MSYEQMFGIAFITLFVFIIIREVICWYFKINERVKLQKESIANQEVLIKLIQNIHVPKLPSHYNCRSVMDPRTSTLIKDDNKENNNG